MDRSGSWPAQAVRLALGARRHRRRMHHGGRRRIFGAGANARARNVEGRRIARRGAARSDRQARRIGLYLRPFDAPASARWWNRRWRLRPFPPKTRTRACRTLPSSARSIGDLAALLRRHRQHRHAGPHSGGARNRRGRAVLRIRASPIPRARRSAPTRASACSPTRADFWAAIEPAVARFSATPVARAGRCDGTRLLVFIARAAIPS